MPEGDVATRVLVVIAHPDDAEFWAGGTIALWTNSGIEVTYCVLTDGDAGGFDPETPRAEIPDIRRAEQLAAAKALGVTDVRFLGHRDGELKPSLALRREVARVIRQTTPCRVLTWTPEWNWNRVRSSHPDHRATGEVALDAVYPDAGSRYAHADLAEDEGLEPWGVREVWLVNSPTPNHYVDVTGAFERKIAALRAHETQTAHRDMLVTEMRRRLAPNSAAAGLEADRLAEAFQVVPVE